MRDNRFRVWDNFRNVFAKHLTAFKFGMDDNVNLIIYLEKVKNIYTNNFEINYFIGLKDMNNKDIYEGDILEQNEELYRVEWNERLCCFVGYTKDRELEMFSFALRKKSIKVVGNIYQNIELLN
jgi:hypothetical protein